MLAVIGGTGLSELEGIDSGSVQEVETPWGSAKIQNGVIDKYPFVFLSRHGVPPEIPPHRINYRANIGALVELGVSEIIAVNTVGSVDPGLEVGDLVLPDQVIDYTWGRDSTFFDKAIRHIDFTFPFDSGVRKKLLDAVLSLGISSGFHDSGTYGCTQGPRLETAAEIKKLQYDGCTLVGMTAMPEAALAREQSIPYASLCAVINKGAGLEGLPVDFAEAAAAMSESGKKIRQIIRRYAEISPI